MRGEQRPGQETTGEERRGEERRGEERREHTCNALRFTSLSISGGKIDNKLVDAYYVIRASTE
jgi:hypothetical protein